MHACTWLYCCICMHAYGCTAACQPACMRMAVLLHMRACMCMAVLHMRACMGVLLHMHAHTPLCVWHEPIP